MQPHTSFLLTFCWWHVISIDLRLDVTTDNYNENFCVVLLSFSPIMPSEERFNMKRTLRKIYNYLVAKNLNAYVVTVGLVFQGRACHFLFLVRCKLPIQKGESLITLLSNLVYLRYLMTVVYIVVHIRNRS